MYLHLGGEKVISTSEIIAIFDISPDKPAKISQAFLDIAEGENKIEVIGEEEAKSLVVTESKIYYSPISSTTLKKRANQLTEL
ncbi:MAG TPA: extracellular matrix/biofilm biosynthesis regulator RemA family protein [Bacilli bacterium]